MKANRMADFTFNPNAPLTTIEKDIALSLLNLDPVRYKDQFPVYYKSLLGNRSQSPQAIALETQAERAQFNTLLTLLPDVYEQFVQLKRTWDGDLSLHGRVTVYRQWASDEARRATEEAASDAERALDVEWKAFSREYESGDLWIKYRTDTSFAQRVGRAEKALTDSPLMTAALPDKHPGRDLLQKRVHKIQERLETLHDIRMRRSELFESQQNIEETLQKLEVDIQNGVDARRIKRELDTLRRSIAELGAYHFYTELLEEDLQLLDARNNERIGDDQLVRSIEVRFNEAVTIDQDRLSGSHDKLDGWKRVTNEAGRYTALNTAATDNQAKGHAYFLYADGRRAYWESRTLPANKFADIEHLLQFAGSAAQRADQHYRNVQGRFNLYDYSLIEALLNEIETENTNAQRRREYNDRLQRFRNRLPNGAPLSTYNSVVIDICSVVENDRLEPDYIDALRAFVSNEVMPKWDRIVGQEAEVFASLPEFALGNLINSAFRLAQSLGVNFENASAQYDTFNATYSSIADHGYSDVHFVKIERGQNPPFDLPVSVDDYWEWLTLLQDQDRFRANRDTLGKQGIVAGYYLLARATRSGASADWGMLNEYIANITHANRPTSSEPDDIALRVVRDANTGYVLQDGLLFAHYNDGFLAWQNAVDTYTAALDRDDIERTLRQLRGSTENDIGLVARMWEVRLKILDFARANRVTMALEECDDFLDSYITEAQHLWAKRRFWEMRHAVESMQTALINKVDVERLKLRPGTSREWLERLLTALFLLRQKGNKVYQNLGREKLNEVITNNQIEQIVTYIKHELETQVLGATLNRSLVRALENAAALRDDIDGIQRGLRSDAFKSLTSVHTQVEHQFDTIEDAVHNVHTHLTNAVKTYQEARTNLILILSNQGLNAADNWELHNIGDRLARIETDVYAAVQAAALATNPAQIGSEDFQRLSQVYETVEAQITQIREKKSAVVQELRAIRQSTLPPLQAYRQIEKHVENIDSARNTIQESLTRSGFETTEIVFEIPDAFYVSDLKGSQLRHLDYQLSLSRHNHQFIDTLRSEYAHDIDLYQPPQLISELRGRRDHKLAVILLRERAEMWNTAVDNFIGKNADMGRKRTGYYDYFDHWLEIAAWHDYLVDHIDRGFRSLIGAAAEDQLPEPETFLFNVRLVMVQNYAPQYRPADDLWKVKGLIADYASKSDELEVLLDAIDQLGDLPYDLERLRNQFQESLAAVEREIPSEPRVIAHDPKRPYQRYLPAGSIDITFSDIFDVGDDMSTWHDGITMMRGRLEQRKERVESLNYVRSIILDYYIPYLDQQIADYQRGRRSGRSIADELLVLRRYLTNSPQFRYRE